MDHYTDEEIATAKATRQVIIESGSDSLKAVYMAGEICQWDELRTETANLINRGSFNIIKAVVGTYIDIKILKYLFNYEQKETTNSNG